MASIPVEILLGIYLGILTGIGPGLVAWTLGFGFKYFTGVTIPGFAVVVLGVALAGVNGGLLALADPSVTQSANAPTVVAAILVVTAITLYAHNRGDAMGATTPRRLSLRRLGNRTLPRDVVELIGGRDEVRIRVSGEVADMEGYPPVTWRRDLPNVAGRSSTSATSPSPSTTAVERRSPSHHRFPVSRNACRVANARSRSTRSCRPGWHAATR